ncbi:hypothetical protein BCEN4_740125 [Burkholderia cenocepacia]|nr:hypothetical protein BCEN4_740125 [Burkholderia cenocepacia]
MYLSITSILLSPLITQSSYTDKTDKVNNKVEAQTNYKAMMNQLQIKTDLLRPTTKHNKVKRTDKRWCFF